MISRNRSPLTTSRSDGHMCASIADNEKEVLTSLLVILYMWEESSDIIKLIKYLTFRLLLLNWKQTTYIIMFNKPFYVVVGIYIYIYSTSLESLVNIISSSLHWPVAIPTPYQLLPSLGLENGNDVEIIKLVRQAASGFQPPKLMMLWLWT